jgi:divalent metal cation (Fe/Co/Zn/Cd) transporter
VLQELSEQDRQRLTCDQCRAYHAGQNYYVEVDIVMDEDTPLKVSHDVSQTLQRKLEGKLAST